MSQQHPRRCALLTLEERDGFFIYDHLLFEPLAALGWQAEEIPWNRPGVNWSDFDAVIIRSTWDYQNHLDAFHRVLGEIESATRLYNPLSVCRWNSHKSYLRELEARGVSIVPSRWEARLDPGVLTSAAKAFGTAKLVVKPCIGANADDTYVIEAGDGAGAAPALETFGDREVIVQPFINSVVEEGEYSLFYFGGEFSHAILKRPATGDFRVQEEHGGLISPTGAPGPVADCAAVALRAVGETLLYARVDVVMLDDGHPALMELELIEPSLYFEQCDRAPAHFARVFARMAAQAA